MIVLYVSVLCTWRQAVRAGRDEAAAKAALAKLTASAALTASTSRGNDPNNLLALAVDAAAKRWVICDCGPGTLGCLEFSSVFLLVGVGALIFPQLHRCWCLMHCILLLHVRGCVTCLAHGDVWRDVTRVCAAAPWARSRTPSGPSGATTFPRPPSCTTRTALSTMHPRTSPSTRWVLVRSRQSGSTPACG
jgi:hypothetical protein